jgi:hypothetical protein
MTTTLPPLPDYVTPEYLAHLRLRAGPGSGQEGDCCAIQERRRWDGLNSCSDAIPDTDSYVIGMLLIQINDESDEWRRRLGPYLVRLRGSGRDERLEIRRALRLWDFALRTLREILPDAIDAGDSERIKLAQELRGAFADLADLVARAARGAFGDLADLAARGDLGDPADPATLAVLAARAARGDLGDPADPATLAVLAARATRAALADLAARAGGDRANWDREAWPRLAALLDELLETA